MSVRLFLKLTLIAVVLLLALSFATSLIPGSEKWPAAVSYVVLFLTSIAAIFYVRKHGADRQADEFQPTGKADDSGRWKMGALVVAMGAFFLLGHSPLGYLMVASGAALVIQYFWLRRRRAGL